MKKTIIALTVAALAGASLQNVRAGDREWAVAGKVLTGLVAGSLITHAIAGPPVYYAAPAPVYYAAPAPVYSYSYCEPAPAPRVVYVQPTPPPVVVYSAPVCFAPAPMIGYRFGYGGGYHHHSHRGGW
jgi:hypothetical protein